VFRQNPAEGSRFWRLILRAKAAGGINFGPGRMRWSSQTGLYSLLGITSRFLARWRHLGGEILLSRTAIQSRSRRAANRTYAEPIGA